MPVIQKEHPDYAYMHNISNGLSFSSSNMSQEGQLQQEEPKEMIVARNTIAT